MPRSESPKCQSELDHLINLNLIKKILLQVGPRREAVVQFFVRSTTDASSKLDIHVEVGSEGVLQMLESTVKVKVSLQYIQMRRPVDTLLNRASSFQYEDLEVRDDKTWLLDNFQGNEQLEIDVKKQIKEVIINTQQAEVRIYGKKFEIL